jgi:hypothetical protein
MVRESVGFIVHSLEEGITLLRALLETDRA